MSTGAAKLVLVIVLAGYVSLLAFTVLRWWQDRSIHQLRQGNQRIRRELDRHTGDSHD